MFTRNGLIAVFAAAVMCWCAGCNGHHVRSGALGGTGTTRNTGNTASPNGGSSNTGAAPGAPVPLVRTRLAPGTVTTPAAGMHCRVIGNTPETYRPDPGCDPGAVDDAVTQNNIDSTICISGYTAKIRPPAAATDNVKKIMYGDYGIPNGTDSELDHLVSLELGGSNDARNLWIEPGKIPNPKDSVENALHKAVCDHKITLAAAQNAIATNWTTALAVTGVAAK